MYKKTVVQLVFLLKKNLSTPNKSLVYLFQKLLYILAAIATLAVPASSAKDGLQRTPWTPGPSIPGVTCETVLDDEEDFSDLAQAGAKAATGNPSAVVRDFEMLHLSPRKKSEKSFYSLLLLLEKSQPRVLII